MTVTVVLADAHVEETTAGSQPRDTRQATSSACQAGVQETPCTRGATLTCCTAVCARRSIVGKFWRMASMLNAGANSLRRAFQRCHSGSVTMLGRRSRGDSSCKQWLLSAGRWRSQPGCDLLSGVLSQSFP